ncbi:CBM35 domain-containing protein [Streptomyces sp. TLI_185]|uniref:CBM35 domain-containing protein n=1 Tax=Streptomyces sp. TLI_185 TaxID=2485151 RepID=UPI000F4FF2C2|nr:CBM35 domain-containing protein [Streptomyces sp. TLI_185]RPF34430.1 carbohydrate-binding protein with CBM35 doain [Streptomyces sp. TLI_185]
MTSGNNGASTPEDDDPFGYLYADGQANGAQPPSGGGGYGYPGSVNRVRAVGQRQYGQPAQAQQTAAYGQVPQQQGTYGQPNAHYAAPETQPGGGVPTALQQPAYGGGGGRRGPNTKGLLIGAVAVVAAVVIGIGVAMMNGNSNDDKANGGSSSTPSTAQSSKPSQSASSSASAELPKSDAKDLTLGPGLSTASDVKGAKAAGGVYVTGFNTVGATVTWSVSDIQKAGSYRLYVGYDIPGVDANATLSVNGKANTQPLGMKNFTHMPQGDWEKGWQSTWAPVTLTKGNNTLEISCGQGNQCNAFLDQVWLTKA